MESNTKDAAEACRSVGDIVKTVLRIVLKDRTLKGSSVRGVLCTLVILCLGSM
jgi:hypothetical protein